MAMTVSPTERRYVRRENPPPFRITPRVLAILDALRRFGVLTSHQIARLDGGSHQKVLRLLQLLFDHRLVDRPGLAQLSPFTSFFDARPCAYSLSRKGAHILASAGVDINTRLDRTTRNKRAVMIEHSVSVAEVMFAIQSACKAHGEAQLADQHMLLPTMPAETQSMRKPQCVRTSVHPADFPLLRRLLKEQIDIGVEPDRIFGLALPNNTGWTFGLELDRSIERVIPKRLKGTSILRKHLGYTAAWQAGKFIEQWGSAFKAFRCLFVTTAGETRIRTMIDAQNQVGAPSGLFLYTTVSRLSEHGALAPIWITTKRNNVSLLERD